MKIAWGCRPTGREGKAGSGAILSAEVRAKLTELWAEEITAELGFEDYPALVEVLEQGG